MELTVGARRAMLRPRGLPGAIERPRAWRRRLRAERRTLLLGSSALVAFGAVAVSEVARIWRRGSAPLPVEPSEVLDAGAEALGQTVEVAIEGYRRGSTAENAMLNLLGAFTLTWGLTRGSTHLIRHHGPTGPFRNLVWGGGHIHHFVPGIGLAFATGGLAVVSRREELHPWLALPFGAGVALTLDESALLLKLDDVYWTEEGIVSVQIGFATLAILSALALALRVLRRGEAVVLEAATGPDDSAGGPPPPPPALASPHG
jgi:hypothetical protein